MKIHGTPQGAVVRDGKYIQFVSQQPAPKTARFEVIAKDNDATLLGTIRWSGAWWCYAFYPEPDTLFESKWLGEIGKFLQDVTTEWKSLI